MNLNKILTVLIVFSMFSFIGAALLPGSVSAADETTTEVTIIGKTGSQTVNLTELQSMTAVSGYSSYQNRYDNWRGQGNYTGVLVSDLVDLVGGMEPGDTVTITASDGWMSTMSYYNVYNAWSDPSIQGNVILAYEYDGNTTPDWEDGLRIAVMPDDGAYSNADAANTTTLDMSGSAGSMWSKWVETITVNEPVWNVTLSNEAWSIVYGDQQIRNITSYTADGGFETSVGTVVGPDTYTGVNVTLLCEAIGGLAENQSAIISARDDYSITYNYDDIVINESTAMVLAYEMNGAPIDEEDVPRIVFIGPDSPIVDGHLSIKMVNSIELAPMVPEYNLNLSGAWDMTMDRSTLESGIGCHSEEYVDGNDTWSGIPLWRLCGWVDTPFDDHEYSDNYNYTVTVYAADGYNKTLTFDEMDQQDDIIVANMKNGEALYSYYPPLRLVGDTPYKSYWVSYLSDIVLNWEIDMVANASETEIAVGDSVEISATISDQGGIQGQNITFWIDDQMIGEATTDATGTASIDYEPSAAGTFTVQTLFTFGDTVNSDNVTFEAIVPASVTVTAPNGGENWQQGSSHNITWTSTGEVDNVKIELYEDGNLSATLSSSTANDGSFTWEIADDQTVGDDFKVKIVAIDDPEAFDMSNNNFEISEKSTDGGLSMEVIAIIIVVIVVIIVVVVAVAMRK